MKLLRKQILLIIAITLITGVVQADEICNNATECQKLKPLSNVKIQQLQGDISQLEDLVRNANGFVRTKLNRRKADELCKAQGKRLPTARELAVEMTKYGAKLLELSQVLSSKVPKSFNIVSTVNPDGKIDQFYYSYRNYVRPAGDLGNYFLWSSSVHMILNEIDVGLDSRDGAHWYGAKYLPHDFGAVRCVSGDSISIGILSKTELAQNNSNN